MNRRDSGAGFHAEEKDAVASSNGANITQSRIVHAGWLNKMGGARGGFKNWKKRWFVLKEDCLYYYTDKNTTNMTLMGVMLLRGSGVLDVCTNIKPAPKYEHASRCNSCTTKFGLLKPSRHCKNCGRTFCESCANESISILPFGFNKPVRVCRNCYVLVSKDLIDVDVEFENDRQTRGGSFDSLSPAAHKPLTDANKGKGVVAQLPKFVLPDNEKVENLFCIRSMDRQLWMSAATAEEAAPFIKGLKDCIAELSKPKNFQKLLSRHKALHNYTKNMREQWEVQFEELAFKEKLGSGAYGDVHRCELWGTDVAVKTLRMSAFQGAFTELMKELQQEIQILSNLRHPNVVLYIGASTKPPNVCILTEYLGRGSLFDIIHNPLATIDCKRMIDFATGVAQGMAYLHSLAKRVIHRDLKSANVLVDKDFRVKVADFGLSKVRANQKFMQERSRTVQEAAARRAESIVVKRQGAPLHASGSQPGTMKEMLKGTGFSQYMGIIKEEGSEKREDENSIEYLEKHYGIMGTPEWMAPEVMEGAKYTEKVDIYSFGIMLTELTARQMPFHDQFPIKSYVDVMEQVLDFGAVPTIPSWCEFFLQPLIFRCLSRDPTTRPSFSEITAFLKEFEDLDSIDMFFMFDLPRLKEMLVSRKPLHRVSAANEMTTLFERGRLTRKDPMQKKVPNGGSTFLRSSLSSVRSSLSALRSSGNTVKDSLRRANAEIRKAECADVDSSKVGALYEDGGKGDVPFPWFLPDEESVSFISTFAALLRETSLQLQYACCRALSGMLRWSNPQTRAEDRARLIEHGVVEAVRDIINGSAVQNVEARGKGSSSKNMTAEEESKEKDKAVNHKVRSDSMFNNNEKVTVPMLHDAATELLKWVTEGVDASSEQSTMLLEQLDMYSAQELEATLLEDGMELEEQLELLTVRIQTKKDLREKVTQKLNGLLAGNRASRSSIASHTIRMHGSMVEGPEEGAEKKEGAAEETMGSPVLESADTVPFNYDPNMLQRKRLSLVTQLENMEVIALQSPGYYKRLPGMPSQAENAGPQSPPPPPPPFDDDAPPPPPIIDKKEKPPLPRRSQKSLDQLPPQQQKLQQQQQKLQQQQQQQEGVTLPQVPSPVPSPQAPESAFTSIRMDDSLSSRRQSDSSIDILDMEERLERKMQAAETVRGKRRGGPAPNGIDESSNNGEPGKVERGDRLPAISWSCLRYMTKDNVTDLRTAAGYYNGNLPDEFRQYFKRPLPMSGYTLFFEASNQTWQVAFAIYCAESRALIFYDSAVDAPEDSKVVLNLPTMTEITSNRNCIKVITLDGDVSSKYQWLSELQRTVSSSIVDNVFMLEVDGNALYAFYVMNNDNVKQWRAILMSH